MKEKPCKILAVSFNFVKCFRDKLMCSKTGELLTDVLTLMIGVIFSPFDSWDLLFIEGYSR